ncbi:MULTISPECIES: hypothetical protein [Leptolyngbya]|uniref:hypothetical protein n=1 Tax=Leptolyngbya TaxID=47251 RepID=UPI0016850362|nr:hypothetical protein [Leptolyngbya sp. FACHB-1624]MBD1859909.1 hypothetical protein [Leptolyngbya sp. FACHB-1624]
MLHRILIETGLSDEFKMNLGTLGLTLGRSGTNLWGVIVLQRVDWLDLSPNQATNCPVC